MSDHELEIDDLNTRAWDATLSDPELAMELATTALARADETGYAAGRANALLNMGWCDQFLTRSGLAIASFQKALDAFTALGDKLGTMKALNALGVTYHELGRYDRAMDYYTRSLEGARLAGNRWREAVTLNNVGEICLDLAELKEALDYFLHAYETVPDDRDAELVSNVLLNIGSTFQRMENWPLALEFTEKALVIADEAGDRLIAARCWLGLGRVVLSADNLEAAEPRFLKALDLAEKLKNGKLKTEVLLELGSIAARGGRADQALERYGEALAVAERFGAKSLIHQAYERISEAHELKGDFKTALDFFRRFSRYEKEVLSEDTSRKIKNITVQYEVEKSRQEAEIYRLRNIELKDKTAELEMANSQILSIAELGRHITSSLDFDTIVSTLYKSLERYMDVTAFGIAIHDETEGILEWRTFLEYGKRLHRPVQRLDYRRSYAAWAIKNRKTIFITDAEVEGKNYLSGGRVSHGKPSESIVVVPLSIEDRVIGVLTIQSYVKHAYTEKHRIFLEALGPYIAIAIENSLIHDRVEELNRVILGEKAELEQAALRISHLANHDSLTGLPNRRLLFELLQKSFDIASRSASKVGVLYVDLDNFKPINDHFGHFAGDHALVIISERLRAILRASDTVARVGGDEFIAVLTNVRDREAIEQAARKILEECSRPLLLDGKECQVGLSIGIAVFPDDGERIDDLVNHSDAAMYRVKHKEKNGFAFFSTGGEPSESKLPALGA
jgi:diguanylate cyclase (GGDEF)-like protein